MAIVIEKTMQGVSYLHHEVVKVNVAYLTSGVRYTVFMNSFINAESMLNQEQGYNWYVSIMNPVSDPRVLLEIEQELITTPELLGGQIVSAPAQLTTLDYAKVRKWSQIKLAKENEITSPLTTPYGVFDCDSESEKRITGAIMLLQTLEGMGTPTTVDFVLADNSMVTLTTAQMVEVGLIMGARVQSVISKASALRTQIFAAQTVEDVEAIVWA